MSNDKSVGDVESEGCRISNSRNLVMGVTPTRLSENVFEVPKNNGFKSILYCREDDIK